MYSPFLAELEPCCQAPCSRTSRLQALHGRAAVPAGGGNVLNVQRTVRQFIAAGAKGCILEDQKWPKKSGSMRGKEVIGLEEHVAKVGHPFR